MVEPLIVAGSIGFVFGTHKFIQYEKIYSKNNRIKNEKAKEFINKINDMRNIHINMLLAFEKTKKNASEMRDILDEMPEISHYEYRKINKTIRELQIEEFYINI